MNNIALVLKDVFVSQKTGRLVCRTAEDQRVFFFQDGVLLYAKTDAPGEELLDILIAQGHVTLEQADQLGLQIQTTRSLGEELLERGLVDRDVFFGALMMQAKQALLNVFLSPEAELIFEDTPAFQAKGLESNLSLPLLIAEGVRRMPYPPELELLYENKVPLLRGETFIDALKDEEKRLLTLIDGRLETKTLAEMSGLSRESFWKSLYLLFSLDLVDFRLGQQGQVIPTDGAAARSPQDLLAEVQVLREALGSIDYHQLLNIPADASLDEIRKAYFEMARRFHPDAFGSDVPPESKQSIFEVFNALTRAYQTLTARERKKAGAINPAATVTGIDLMSVLRQSEERAQGRVRANILFRKGQKLYDEGRFGGAAAMFQESVHLDGQSAEYYLWLARAEAKVPTLVKKAEKDFQQAARLNPKDPECLVGLGMLYKKEGLLNLAAKQFEKAAEIDPSHPIVRRELESLKPPEKKKGLFGFKK
jgi:tetratricopeptide (TPR) repeat protein